MSTWITDHEKKIVSDLQMDLESAMMFGGTIDIQKYKNEALTLLNLAMSQGDIKIHRYQQLLKLIDTNQRDNIKMVINIIKAKTDGTI